MFGAQLMVLLLFLPLCMNDKTVANLEAVCLFRAAVAVAKFARYSELPPLCVLCTWDIGTISTIWQFDNLIKTTYMRYCPTLSHKTSARSHCPLHLISETRTDRQKRRASPATPLCSKTAIVQGPLCIVLLQCTHCVISALVQKQTKTDKN